MRKGHLSTHTVVIFLFGLGLIVLLNSCYSSKKENKPGSKTEIQTVLKSPPKAPEAALPPYMADGRKVYRQVCLTCHQANGKGVSGLNPPLTQTDYVLGDKNRLLEIIIKGSEANLKDNTSEYANVMQGYGMLGDKEIANVASYIRNSFGNKAEPITVEEVTSFRSANKK